MLKEEEIEKTQSEAYEILIRLQSIARKVEKLSSETDKLRVDILAKYDRLEELGVK